MRRSFFERLLIAVGTVSLVACTGGYGSGVDLPGGGSSGGTFVSADLGLVSAVAGDAEVRLDWKASDVDAMPLSVALFQGLDPATLFSGAPIANASGDGSFVASGLVNGTKYFFGLALDSGGGSYEPVGAIVWGRPNPPIYVQAGADPNLADGLTPATAFPDPFTGILTALASGAGNVWLGSGDYVDVALPLYSRVDLYGGFGADFSLAARDPAAFPTRLHGKSPLNLFTLIDGNTGSVLDGLELLGDAKGVIALESHDTPCQLRSLVVRGLKGRGLKIISTVETLVFDATVVNCVVDANGADGLFVQGAVNLTVERSRFTGNGQEGLECGSLIAPDGERVRLEVRRSQFADNAFEGLKVNLRAPTVPFVGGAFEIAVEGSSFERNRQKAGLLLDIDFNLVAGWSLDLVLRGCLARNNENDGVQLQLDSTSTTLIHGLVASANGGDGLQVSSQSTPSQAIVAASVFAGNRGFGLLAENGNVPVHASHSIFAGNSLGGFASTTVESSATSSVATLQANAFSGVRTHFVVSESDPDAPLFVRAPREYREIDGLSGSKWVLDDLGGLTIGDRIELGDDSIARAVTSLGPGSLVGVDPQPTALLVPTSLFVFAAGASVVEDFDVVANSVASGAAMVPVGAPPVDAGPLGAPGAPSPGMLAADPLELFFLARSTPRIDQALDPSQPILLEFLGGALDPSTADATRVRALDASGQELAIVLTTIGAELQLAPAGGAWPVGELTIEVHAGLAAVGGSAQAAPLALPYTVL
ncbi:MAG: right-handed parallel beta-helix repeat-containing protein [Planctomycetes bacterium]|nr:right-handed parallel beta-helix repeat-containing protein [Planctomycetota bacterium]